jgi:leucine-rich repeat protein SHOC2
LNRLPDDIGKLKELTHVSLDFNQLTSLPDTLADLNKLNTFYAAFNMIEKVPTALLRHKTLQNLALNTNHLRQIDINMPNLAYLDLSNNTIATIPAMHLPFVLYIYLDGNQLTEFPVLSEVSSALSWLTISRNNLTKLHESLKGMSRLELLDLRNNSFSTLPAWLSDLGSLTHLTVHDNPLCSNGWTAEGNLQTLMDSNGCRAQCSPMCLDAQLEFTDCNLGCNSEGCNYDHGQCG